MSAEPARERATVVSLDIWDTVLRRRCHPDEVKLFKVHHMWSRLGPALREDVQGP